MNDLYFGEVLFYAYQDMHFEALARLDTELAQHYSVDEPELDPLFLNRGQAEFSIGDIELQYRMDKRAGKAIQAVLGAGVDLATRNQAAYALARMFYRKNDAPSTLYALDLIRDTIDTADYQGQSIEELRGQEPEGFRVNVAYLRSLALIDTGQFSKAVQILESLRNEVALRGYVHYNLGIALIQAQREPEGLRVLDELGQLSTDDGALMALKDKTNLKLAYRVLDAGDAALAATYFQRVRLDGPYSNRALLGSGWAAVAMDRYDRALVPWSILHQRQKTNHSVQEAIMALPYAYGKLEAYGKSANLYDYGLDVFANETANLDASIESIRLGKFLEALVDEHSDKDTNWVVSLREIPETPETRYVLDLLASHNFQSSYKNYKDLSALEKKIDRWLDDLEDFEELIEIRRAYQEPLLPEVEEKFKKIDARAKLRLEQRNGLAKKIQNMLISPRPEFLATADERIASNRIGLLEQYEKEQPGRLSSEELIRVKRLRGVLLWRVHSEYDERLTEAYNNLLALDEIIQAFQQRYYSFIRTRQAATQSYEGYQIPIQKLRTSLLDAQRRIKGVKARQGKLIESMAINELDRRRKRLEDYQIKARFALAESYDRATGAKVDEQIEELKRLKEEQQSETDSLDATTVPEENQEGAGAELDSDASILEQIPTQ